MNDGAPAVELDTGVGGAGVVHLTFTGRGDEYFRIWIVNLFLTLLTLGIYSAWAKVRKTKYFWQNTRLDGAVFDFHGNPVAILKGRIIALLLLVAYTWGFEFSLAFGLVTVAVLLVAGPWLFMKAQQFKFGNTSYRGLRFGFAATYRESLRIVLPILVIWFSTTVMAAVISEDAGGLLNLLALVGVATLLLVPWMHHRLKLFQHARGTYGNRAFTFALATPAFYRVYAKGLGLVIAGGIAGAIVTGLIGIAVTFERWGDPPDWVWFVSGVSWVLIMYVFVWPYLAARLQQVIWTHTRLGDIAFHTEIAAWPLAKLVLRNIALTLVTAGLYWPYAAIALARYRVECMRIDSDTPLAAIAAGMEASPAPALGDAAADSFGFDIGL